MSEQTSGADCRAEFQQLMPPKPWTAETTVKAFEPLINLIDQHTQSDMFRHAGEKYQGNGDYYEMAQNLDADNQDSGAKTFANGVKATVQQADGWPVKLELEDKAAGLKEAVTFNAASHNIESDQVEYCGVSRTRKFSQGGESFRSYGFDGGTVEKSSALPLLKLE